MSKLITIPFHDDLLFAFEEDASVFVAVKPISDGLGLRWSGQHDRLNRDPILAEGIRVTRMPSPGGEQETVCLRLDLLQGWLFGIDAARVKPEARDRVLAYKRECCAVLFRHFYGAATARGELPDRGPEVAPAIEEPTHIRRQLVTEARQTFGSRAAGSLWFALGLPIVPEMQSSPRQGVLDLTALPAPAARRSLARPAAGGRAQHRRPELWRA